MVLILFHIFLDKLRTVMEISSGPSESNCEMVMKTIRTTLFRCLTCRKAFKSEEGVKKHLEKLHAISDLPESHYEAFVGVKRVNVPKEPAKEKEIADPSIDSTSIAGISFKCSMCDNVYHTFEGVKGHLISFHDVTSPVSSDLIKYIFSSSSKKSIKTSTKHSIRFVTPTLENKLASKLKNDKVPLTEKQDDVKKKQGVKRKIQEGSSNSSKKPKIDFCRSLTNMFNSGNIKARSLDLSSNDKKKKESDIPHLNGTQELGYQSQLCFSESIREPDKSQGEKYYFKKTQPQNTPRTTNNTESQNTIAQSHISLSSLQTKQSHSKQKVRRMKILCDDSECRLKGLCSKADCGVCRFCQNRKLK